MKDILVIIGFLISFSSGFSQKIIYNNSFEKKTPEWETRTKNLKTSIKEGRLIIENKDKVDQKWILADLINSPDNSDFDIEVDIEILDASKPTNSFGLVWSGYRNDKYYKLVNLNPNKNVQLLSYENGVYDYYKKWENNEIIKEFGETNKIVVKKRGSNSKVFINGILIHQLGGTAYYGSKIGFKLDAKTKIAIHKVKIINYKKKTVNVVSSYNPTLKINKINAVSNPYNTEVLPVVSADGKTMYLNVKDHNKNVAGPKDDIYISTRNEKNEWQPYLNAGRPLNNESYNYVISVSPDNNTLLLGNKYSKNGREFAGEGISISKRTKDGWEIPKPINIVDFKNSNIYSEYFLTSSNKQLLMTVERPEGFGGKDIYVSFASNKIKDSVKWSKPINLGKVINGFANEAYPFLASDGRTLYFSSKSHQGYGGFDLFVSKRQDNSWTNWSQPKNLGNIINTTGTDLSLFLSTEGNEGYLARESDIYVFDNTVKHDPVALIKGVVYDKKTGKTLSAPITYYNINTGEELGTAISHPKTGRYSIVLPFGENYSLMAKKDGYYAETKQVDLTDLTEYTEIEVDLYLTPFEKGQKVRLNNVFFNSGAYDLLPESNAELNKLFKVLKKNQKLIIEISGHTDAIGNDNDNLLLSKNRANAVMNYLLKKGISQKQLSAKGFGETQFKTTNDTKKGRQLNRRVEFEILAL